MTTMPRTPEANREYMKVYYEANKPRLLALQRDYRKIHPQQRSAAQRADLWASWYARNKAELLRKQRSQLLSLKLEMIVAYGGGCACCGEMAYEFLTLDHVNRDGAQHRRTVGSTKQVYMDLKRRGWPKDGYRLLCMNCNFATRYGDPCPHELEALAAVDGHDCP